MKRPANQAPASGPTVAAEEEFGRDRDPSTGRFVETEGGGRSDAERRAIAVRRAGVERLYPKKTCAEIGAELGWATPTIWQDVKALGLERRRPGVRQKHPDQQPRPCANPDCREIVTPRSWEPDRRFCSIACARKCDRTPRVRQTARELRAEQHRRAGEEIARLNAAGYLTAGQVAAKRKVTSSAVSQWIARGLLNAERRRVIEGETHRLVAQGELDRFNAEEWPRICKRMGPGFPANWKGDSRRVWSRRLRAPVVGKLHKPGYTEEQVRLVREIKRATPTLGREPIAGMVTERTGKPITEKQVRKILENLPG
jgi:hypothetical protein